jgi:hypothetical protein
VRGVNATARGKDSIRINNYWRTNQATRPRDLVDGNADRPWARPNSWYGRSWKVGKILDWFENNFTCRFLKCANDVLIGTTAVPGDSEFNQKRRRGSRWYASVIAINNDIWETGKALGYDRFEEILRGAGANEAANVLVEIKNGRRFSPNDLPFEWWPVMQHCSFANMRDSLIRMKDYFPEEAVLEAEEARTATRRTRDISKIKVWLSRYLSEQEYNALLQADPNLENLDRELLQKYKRAKKRILELSKKPIQRVGVAKVRQDIDKWWKKCDKEGWAAWSGKVLNARQPKPDEYPKGLMGLWTKIGRTGKCPTRAKDLAACFGIKPETTQIAIQEQLLTQELVEVTQKPTNWPLIVGFGVLLVGGSGLTYYLVRRSINKKKAEKNDIIDV